MIRNIIDFIFPPLCYACEGKITDKIVCEDCWDDMLSLTVNEPKFYYGYKVYSVFVYESRVENLLRNLKYSGYKIIAEKFAEYMAALISDENVDFIVPVPLHPARRRERGFSQTEVLAKAISKHLKKPVIKPIFRYKYTKPQAVLSLKEREDNIKGAFSYLSRVNDRVILLVDDVITTGFTFYECAKVLMRAGARDVIGITLARGGV